MLWERKRKIGERFKGYTTYDVVWSKHVQTDVAQSQISITRSVGSCKNVKI